MKILNKVILLFIIVAMLLPCVAGINSFAYVTEWGISAQGKKTGAYKYNNLTYDVVNGEAVIMYSAVSGNIIIPDVINGYKVTQIADYAFEGCDAITGVITGDNLKRIGHNAFYRCALLSYVDLGSSLEEIGDYAFRYCTLLQNISIPDSVIKLGYGFIFDTLYYNTASNWVDNTVLYIDNCVIKAKSGISGSYKIKSGVRCIADGAFRNCKLLTSVTIPDTTVTIGNSAFDSCENLATIIIPDSVVYIFAYAFQNCTKLSSISVGANIRRIEYYAFHNTAYENNYNKADGFFYLGNYLIYADPSVVKGKVSVRPGTLYIAERAFCDCEAVTEVVLPEGLKGIGHVAFSGCDIMTKVNIPKTVESIGGDAFIYCKKLVNVVIGDVAAWCNINFENCDSNPFRNPNARFIDSNGKELTEITIPSSVTAIQNYAFYKCTFVKKIIFHDKVTFIGTDSFLGCDGIVFVCDKGSFAYNYAKEKGIDIKGTCEHSFTRYISNNDHSCTTDGTATAVCDYGCGVTDTMITKKATGHAFERYISNNDLSCSRDETATATCQNGCGTRDTKVIRKSPGHVFENYRSNNDRTCTVDGTSTAFCKYGCGMKDTKVTDSATGHSFTKYVYNNDLSCGTDGTETAVCNNGCGETSSRIVSFATGHSFGDYIPNNDRTCTHDGTATAYCIFGCGTSEIKVLEKASGHIYTKYVSNNDLSCTHDETATALCIYGCGKEHTKTLKNATGHIFGDYAYNDDLSCIHDGTETAICIYNCGIEDTRVVSEATGHIFGEYISNNDRTCTHDGTATAYCRYNCGESVTKVESTAVGHRYSDYVPNNDQTCTREGTATAFCDYGCGRKSTKIIAMPIGHSYGDWTIITEATSQSEGLRTHSCTVCGSKQDETIPKVVVDTIFTDVKETHWFAGSVMYCVQKGYVAGMTATTFVPNGNITRAQFLVMLAKLDGADLSIYEGRDAGFTDVKPSHWYNTYVCWAVENEFTSGLSETKFGPNNDVTRAQLARFFYVYSEKKGIAVDGRADISAFPDEDKVAAWAKDSIAWAVDAGIISGVKKDNVNYLTPNGTATRAQATVMFKAFDAFRE